LFPPKAPHSLKPLIGSGLTAKPVKPRKVLVFTDAKDCVHGEGIVYGIKALENAARTGAFAATFSSDYTALTDKKALFTYDAVVLNNTTRLKAKENPALVPNLIEFVKSGRGLCVIHAAPTTFTTAPTQPKWSAGSSTATRGRPAEHGPSNWMNRPTRSTVLSAAKALNSGMRFISKNRPSMTAPNCAYWCRLTFPTKRLTTSKKKRADNDYAVSWIRPYGQAGFFIRRSHTTSGRFSTR
jgi:hypothetical protein